LMAPELRIVKIGPNSRPMGASGGHRSMNVRAPGCASRQDGPVKNHSGTPDSHDCREIAPPVSVGKILNAQPKWPALQGLAGREMPAYGRARAALGEARKRRRAGPTSPRRHAERHTSREPKPSGAHGHRAHAPA
jgi:hypothetical protein